MENLIAKGENISRQKSHYPLSSTKKNSAKGLNQSQAANAGEETNTLTMILITLAMMILTVAVIAKVIAMFTKGLMKLLKTQLSWLRFQH
jgi:hypothetical protein